MQNQYARVHNNIFISTVFAIQDELFLKRYDVGAIVKCDSETEIKHATIPTFVLDGLHDTDLDRKQRAALMEKLHAAVDHIHAFVTENPKKSVVVHCYGGQNRSALVIGLYLMKYCELPYQKAFNMLNDANKTRSVPALWNGSFRQILRDYERELDDA